MTARSIRRLAERRAKKLTEKTTQQSGLIAMLETEIPLPLDETEAEARVETQPESPTPTIIPAATANAYLIPETSPLTGELTLHPATDAAPYDQLLHDYQNELHPIGLQESELVQTLAETIWRTRRLRALESAIFAKGRIEFAAQFAEHNPGIRESLLDVHTFLTYEKQLRGLQLQESRLCRRSDKARAELRTLQQERQKREEHARRKLQENPPPQPKTAAPHNPVAALREPNGFEYSNSQFEPHLTRKEAA
jgi:hypothetical protein